MKAQRIIISSLVLVIGLVFTACAQVSSEEPVETDRQESEVAVEVIEEEPLTDSAVYAANPELKIVSRYANRTDEGGTGSAFYAANPELMIADRYTAPILEDKQASNSTFFATNPELMAAGRYISQEMATESEIFAANPELMAAHRYTAAATEK